MMVIVPRIAVVSYLDTIPFIYGVTHEGNFRAELLLSSPSDTILDFSSGRANIALVPADAVPSLTDACIVTEYCIGASPGQRQLLHDQEAPDAAIRGEFLPEAAAAFDPRKPFAYAVWVAHTDVAPETIEAFNEALTFGLERSYEALLDAGRTDMEAAYGFLSQIDYIFDNQKHKALEKFWASGLKVTPRANPG